jgi:site-specific DNA-cytosine methylase
MSKANRKIITSTLNNVMDTDIYMTMLDSSLFGVQTRKRLYWTNFIISGEPQCTQTWSDVLEPLEHIWKYRISEKMIMYNNTFLPRKTSAREQIRMVSVGDKKWKYELGEKANYRTRWDVGMTSDTTNRQELNRVYPIGKCRTIITTSGNNNIVVDRRTGHDSFTVRQFSPIERERLFNFPDDWTKCLKYKTTRGEVLGNSVVINVLIYILDCLP